jgi:hypothetical protein
MEKSMIIKPQPSSLLTKGFKNRMREQSSFMAGAQGIQKESGVMSKTLHFPFNRSVFYLISLFSLLASFVCPISLATIKAGEVFL